MAQAMKGMGFGSFIRKVEFGTEAATTVSEPAEPANVQGNWNSLFLMFMDYNLGILDSDHLVSAFDWTRMEVFLGVPAEFFVRLHEGDTPPPSEFFDVMVKVAQAFVTGELVCSYESDYRPAAMEAASTFLHTSYEEFLEYYRRQNPTLSEGVLFDEFG